MSASEATDADDLDWRRPHPITILVEIGMAFRSLIIAIIVIRGSSGYFGIGAAAEFLVILAPLSGGLARWYTTRYALGPESVHYRHGLLRRQKQVLPRSNVQNVSSRAGIISRLASVVELQISDASSSGDIKLRLIGQEEAERLTTLLRSSMPAPHQTQGEHDSGTGPPPRPPLPIPPGRNGLGAPGSAPERIDGGGRHDLIDRGPATAHAAGQPPSLEPSGLPVTRPALVKPSLKAVLMAEATSMSSLSAVIASLTLVVAGLGLSRRLTLEILPGVGQAGSIALIAAVPIVAAVLAVAGRVPVLGGFRLHADPDRLRIQAGLLTETKVAARRERIQQIGIGRDLPHRWLGIERVRYETADVDLQTTAATRFLDPAGSSGGWKVLAEAAIGGTRLDESDLRPVSSITIRRTSIRLLPIAIAPAVLGGLFHPIGAVVGVVAWVAFVLWYARRRFAVLGWATDDEHYLVRSGVFYNRMHLIRLDKIQSLRLTSSLLQRRFDLATLSLSTAGVGLAGLVSMPDLPQATGERLLDELALRAAQTPIDETL